MVMGFFDGGDLEEGGGLLSCRKQHGWVGNA